MTTPLRHGDTLMLDDPRVVGVYSVGVAEDGQTVLAMYDLADGSTGCASWHWRDPPGASRFVRVVMAADG
jgi:hypothetical protein